MGGQRAKGDVGHRCGQSLMVMLSSQVSTYVETHQIWHFVCLVGGTSWQTSVKLLFKMSVIKTRSRESAEATHGHVGAAVPSYTRRRPWSLLAPHGPLSQLESVTQHQDSRTSGTSVSSRKPPLGLRGPP